MIVKTQEVSPKYTVFSQEVTPELQDKQTYQVKLFPAGEKIFPFAIPPRIEILPLNPKDPIHVCRTIA
jgi:hypothetical protein